MLFFFKNYKFKQCYIDYKIKFYEFIYKEINVSYKGELFINYYYIWEFLNQWIFKIFFLLVFYNMQ